MVKYYVVRKMKPGVFAAYTPSGAPVSYEKKPVMGATPREIKLVLADAGYVELARPSARGVGYDVEKVSRAGIRYPTRRGESRVSKGGVTYRTRPSTGIQYATLPSGFGAKNKSIYSALVADVPPKGVGGKYARLPLPGVKVDRILGMRRPRRDTALRVLNNHYLSSMHYNPLEKDMIYQAEIADEINRIRKKEGLAATVMKRLAKEHRTRGVRTKSKGMSTAHRIAALREVPPDLEVSLEVKPVVGKVKTFRAPAKRKPLSRGPSLEVIDLDATARAGGKELVIVGATAWKHPNDFTKISRRKGGKTINTYNRAEVIREIQKHDPSYKINPKSSAKRLHREYIIMYNAAHPSAPVTVPKAI